MLDRINRARGDYLRRTGRELEWGDIGRALGWKAATITDVKKGRPLRLSEIGPLAQLLGVTPGWLAFAQGPESPQELADALAWLATTRPRPAAGGP